MFLKIFMYQETHFGFIYNFRKKFYFYHQVLKKLNFFIHVLLTLGGSMDVLVKKAEKNGDTNLSKARELLLWKHGSSAALLAKNCIKNNLLNLQFKLSSIMLKSTIYYLLKI